MPLGRTRARDRSRGHLGPPPPPPSISGAPTIGGTLTITSGGGSVASYQLLRNGRVVGTVTNGYTYKAGDMDFGGITVRAVGTNGRVSGDSNRLTYAFPSTPVIDIDGTHVTLNGGFIDTAINQGSGGNLVQASAANRPAQGVGTGPFGRDVLDFSLRSSKGTNLAIANAGLGSAVTVAHIGTVGANGRYPYDGAAINTRALFNNGGTSEAMFAGSAACGLTCVPGDIQADVAVFNGASSKHSVDSGAIVTGNVGASTSVGSTVGGTAGIANDAQGLNGIVMRHIEFNSALTDAQHADLMAFLQSWKANNPTSPRVLCIGDSMVHGAMGYTGGWRTAALAALRVSRPTANFVGPYYSNGAHCGIVGITAATVAGNTAQYITSPIDTANPDIVVIALGVNDVGANANAATIEGYLSTIVTAAKAAKSGVKIVVLTVVKPGAGAAGFYGSNRAVCDTVNTDLVALTASWGATLCNVGAPTLGGDAIHPVDGAGGYDSMGAAIGATLVSIA